MLSTDTLRAIAPRSSRRGSKSGLSFQATLESLESLKEVVALREITWTRDVSDADWLPPCLHPFARDVGSIIPDSYPAYIRIFHEPRSANLRSNWPPGSVPMAVRRILIEALRAETSTPARCCFCVWEGWGDLDDLGVTERLHLPGRAYLMHEGPIDMALASPPRRSAAAISSMGAATVELPKPGSVEHDNQSASLWWPADRAWFVSTEVDDSWTYLAGSQKVIDSLVNHPSLDVSRTSPSDRLFPVS